MKTVTLAEVLSEVKRLSGTQNIGVVGQDMPATDTDLTAWVGQGVTSLYETIRDAGGQERFSKNYKFSTQVGLNIYPLPSDFVRILSIVATISGTPYELEPFAASEKAQLRRDKPFVPKYRCTGKIDSPTNPSELAVNQVYIEPAPTSVYEIELDYLPVFQNQSFVPQSYDMIDNSGYQYVLAYVLVKLYQNFDEDEKIAFYTMERDAKRLQILKTFKQDVSKPMRVVPSYVAGAQRYISSRGGPWY
jgi:hypothetical protein